MATRRLHLMAWQRRRDLIQQARRQEDVARHLMHLADALDSAGRSHPARRMFSLGLRFRVRGICLLAQASTLDWPVKTATSR
jgi:hypothetical protein